MAGAVYEGWQGSGLYKVEATPGTPVVPDTSFGVLRNYNPRSSANLEAEGGIGTHLPVSLEEGVLEVGGSLEFLPQDKTTLLLAKRTSGLLSSYTFHGSAGPGVHHTGVKVNQLRMSIDAGGRFRSSLDWFALGAVDNAAIAAVIATTELMNWIKLVTNLPDIVAGIEIVVSHNLRRVPVIANGSTVLPVTAEKRAPYIIKEGRQRVEMTARFFERPSPSVVADLLTEIASQTFVFTGLVGGTPITFTVSLSNGKPNVRELSMSEGGDAMWPLSYIFKDWNVA